ncbi:MAG: TIGR04086 family membrane protein [Clostridia bacterium]|nr:TIGR04086 family membrane protein [Clostridia bacterium]
MKVKAAKFKEPKVKKVRNDDSVAPIWQTILKGSLIALSISLVGILIFAFLIKYIAIPTEAIKPVNQVIKGISLLVGTFFALRKIDQMGLVKGLLIGLAYTLLGFFVFSILDGNFELDRTLFNDFLFGGIIGAICGIISVNFRRKATN